MKPMRAIRAKKSAAVFLAAVIAASLTAGCGTDSPAASHPTATQHHHTVEHPLVRDGMLVMVAVRGELRLFLTRTVGADISITCPEAVRAVRGQRFQCTAARQSGRPLILGLTETDSNGSIRVGFAYPGRLPGTTGG